MRTLREDFASAVSRIQPKRGIEVKTAEPEISDNLKSGLQLLYAKTNMGGRVVTPEFIQNNAVPPTFLHIKLHISLNAGKQLFWGDGIKKLHKLLSRKKYPLLLPNFEPVMQRLADEMPKVVSEKWPSLKGKPFKADPLTLTFTCPAAISMHGVTSAFTIRADFSYDWQITGSDKRIYGVGGGETDYAKALGDLNAQILLYNQVTDKLEYANGVKVYHSEIVDEDRYERTETFEFGVGSGLTILKAVMGK